MEVVITIPEQSSGGVTNSSQLLTLTELCEWLNITERHARKLVERNSIPYRKVGHLLRFSQPEVDTWSRPVKRVAEDYGAAVTLVSRPARVREKPSAKCIQKLPKSILD
jgi:excisionase family DNA binding protein